MTGPAFGTARVRPAFHPSTGEEGGEVGVLVLRDGTRLRLWRALAEDAGRILGFLGTLPPRDLELVEEALGEGSSVDDFLGRLAEARAGEAFFAEEPGERRRVAAFAGFRERIDDDSALLTLAVAPEFREMGIATLLLERLSVLAARRGVSRLVATVPLQDEALVRLFRSSGFDASTTGGDGHATFALRTAGEAGGPATDAPLAARVAETASLRALFFPRSVAVVGASRDPASVGHRILQALIREGFNGPVYAINPGARHVGSIPAHPSVEAVGAPVDLAVVVVPAGAVPEVVESCARARVRGLVVITAGYAETGEEGRERQRALRQQVRGHGMRMVGPNCLGLIHTHPDVRLNASFAPEMPPRGSVALCSQSGALGIAIIALARQLGLGLSAFVSVGNKADVSGNDLLEYWEEDPDTRVVLFYLESFGNPRRFARIARRVARRKPVVVVKAGRSEAGGRAATSHTAALAVADTAVEALFHQTGIVRADTLQEMFDVARALVEQPLPPGRQVAVLTNAGGPAILCADALEAAGLTVEPLAEATRAELQSFLPATASVANPVDMIASAGEEEFRRAAAVLLGAPEVDALVVLYTPVGLHGTAAIGNAVARGVAEGRQTGGRGKPVLASIVGGEEDVHALAVPGDGEVIPCFRFPEELATALGKTARYAAWRGADPGVFPEFGDADLEGARGICAGALEARGPGWLTVEEARSALERAGLVTTPGGVAATEEEAVRIADSVGYPVALKLASTRIVHKTEVGGVRLGLEDPDQVRQAFRAIRERLEAEGEAHAMEGVLVQPMLAGTAEVMVGASSDPVFGPLVAFGLGGIHVEILRDVAFRVAPLTDRDAREMVRSIRGFRLLEGYRGHPAADVPALEDAVCRISRLVEAVPEIEELDLNPIFALPPGQGYRIADARVRVGRPTPRTR